MQNVKFGFGELVDVSSRITITVAEAARLLNCKESTVRKEIERKQLSGGFKVGGRYKINWIAFSESYGFREEQLL